MKSSNTFENESEKMEFQKIEQLLSIIPDMISVHDPHMNILYSNWKGYGNVPEEKRKLNTKCYHTYRGYNDICPDCQAKIVLQTKKSIQMEIEVDDHVWVDLRVIPFVNKEGEVEFFMEWVRDITQRKITEAALKASEKRYRTYIENAPEGIFIVDDKGHYIDVNQKACELTGYSRHEILNKYILDISSDKQLEKNRQSFLTLKEEGFVDTTILIRKKNGKEIYTSLRGIKLNSNRYIGFCSDITEKFQIREELKLNKERLEVQLQLHKMRNENFEKITRFTLEKAVELTTSTFGYFAIINDDRTRLMVHTWHVDPKERKIKFEKNGFKISKKGLWTSVLKHKKPIITNKINDSLPPFNYTTIQNQLNIPLVEEDMIVAIAGVINKPYGYSQADIQQLNLLMQAMWTLLKQKKMEEQLIQTRKMDAIGQLAGGVAHDFNNIIASILGFSEVLKDSEGLSDDQEEYLNFIIKESKRAAVLTKKLLTFSRKSQISYETLDFHQIVNDTLIILKRSINKKISVKKKFKAEKSIIIGDKYLLQNAIMNIAINAVQAMSNGGTLSVNTKNVYLDTDFCNQCPHNISPGKYLDIEIRDTGSGMSQETLNQIFDPFFTTKPKDKGTGLGLSVVYGIVHDHHGAIQVSSKINKGTSFHLLFPVNKGEFIRKQEIQPQLPIQGKEKILIVDDEESIRLSLKLILEKIGYSVSVAKGGLQALEMINSDKKGYDLIILDMIMPDLDGKETFAKIRKINPELKILLSSGYAKEQDLEQLRGQKLDGFLQKPYQKSRLIKKVEEILQ